MTGLVAMMVFGVTLHIKGVGRMSKIGNYVVEMQEMVSTRPCPYCNGDGQVEVALAPDCFREDDCENCNGSGEIVLEDEDE